MQPTPFFINPRRARVVGQAETQIIINKMEEPQTNGRL